MPTLITGEKLSDAVKNQTFILNGSEECAEGVKYDFRLSKRILKASFHGPIDADKLSVTEQAKLMVDPGEMVFVLTEEHLNLPVNMIAQLSPKRKLSHAGILAIGGFCIDPLYAGPLLIGLFNFSSTGFRLIPGKKVIAATFYELVDSEKDEFVAPQTTVEDFPDELIQVMQKYSPVSIVGVADVVEKLKSELENLRNEIRSRDEWYERFRKSLEHHDKQISELLRGLDSEVQARARGEDRLSQALIDQKKQLDAIQSSVTFGKAAFWVASGITGAIVVPIVVALLLKAFHLI